MRTPEPPGIQILAKTGRLPGLRDLVEQVQVDAEIIPGTRVSPDVVTMNSTVSFVDEKTGLWINPHKRPNHAWDCAVLNLGYRDPATINPADWMNRALDTWKGGVQTGVHGVKAIASPEIKNIKAFDPVTAQVVRLNILEATDGPTIWEFQLLASRR